MNVTNKRAAVIGIRFTNATAKPPENRQAVVWQFAKCRAEITDNVITAAGSLVLDDLVLSRRNVPVVEQDHHDL